MVVVGVRRALGLTRAAAVVALLWPTGGWPALAQGADPPGPAGQVERGAYVFDAAGCFACHTDLKGKGAPLAGGRALETPYGTFYTPNITPDPEHGIGGWSEADFLRALRGGVAPDGRQYYPAFPYTAYTGMSDADARALWAYLKTRSPANHANTPHDLSFPYSLRPLMRAWKALFFEEGVRVAEPSRGEAWNRGAYLVNTLGHCGECHTPRNFLGGFKRERHLAGALAGPDGKKVPNITPHETDGIGDWSESDITFFLKTGFLPDGDVAGAAMTDVIEYSTSRLNDADRAAIATYLMSVEPIAGP